MVRPEGALSPAELDKLLDKHGKVRVYGGYPPWHYFVKELGPKGPKYRVVFRNGNECPMDWPGLCHAMRTFPEYTVFINYWHYYAYMLRQGEHAKLLP